MFNALLLAFAVTSASATPLTPYTGAQGKGTASVAPGVNIDPAGLVDPSTYFAGAMGDTGDYNIGTGLSFSADGASASFVDVLPSFFLDEHLAIVPHVSYEFGGKDVAAGVEVHHVLGDGALTMATNVAWMSSFGASGTGPGTLSAIVAPEVYVSDRFSMFVEVDPAYDLAARSLTAVVVPGVSACFDAACNHAASAGVGLNVVGPVAPTVGAWYSYNFSVGKSDFDVASSEE